ncbi:GntR family transcriptional regulator [Mycoplasmopsis pullorum]|nr:GntR family transcriptional regulator [Mycoplasmopsis pullorum]
MMSKEIKKTQIVIDYLMDLIKTKKVPTNRIMPSEHALMAKFDCSRSVVISAYNKLESLGAVYSISKRGHFVAENFHNLIKPLGYMLGADSERGWEVQTDQLPEWTVEDNIIFIQGFRFFEKEYFLNQEMIAKSEIYLSKKYLRDDQVPNLNQPLLDLLNDQNGISNIVYKLKYEKIKLYDRDELVVVYFFGYDDESISIAGKYFIKPENFIFFHQEFSAKQ